VYIGGLFYLWLSNLYYFSCYVKNVTSPFQLVAGSNSIFPARIKKLWKRHFPNQLESLRDDIKDESDLTRFMKNILKDI